MFGYSKISASMAVLNGNMIVLDHKLDALFDLLRDGKCCRGPGSGVRPPLDTKGSAPPTTLIGGGDGSRSTGEGGEDSSDSPPGMRTTPPERPKLEIPKDLDLSASDRIILGVAKRKATVDAAILGKVFPASEFNPKFLSNSLAKLRSRGYLEGIG